MRLKWRGIVKANTGLLLGGKVHHVSWDFDEKESAKRWVEVVVNTNKKAGRDPNNGRVKAVIRE